MDDLRVILLLTGGVFIGCVYLWSRFQHRPARREKRSAAHVAHDDADVANIEQELASMGKLVAERDHDPDWHDPVEANSTSTAQANPCEQVHVISIIAEDGEPFRGDKLLKAFDNNDLVHGSKGIYERRVEQAGRDKPVFGVANLVKPGTFPRDMLSFTSPGITLFLQLPCAIDALDAFDDFMNTAERLAVELAGELRDEKHQLLTHQVLLLVRERIAESQARMHMAAS